MFGYTTLILPLLSGARLAILAATHIISARGIVLVAWFLFLTVHAVVAWVYKVPMHPTLSTTTGQLGVWFFGFLKFV